MYKEVGFIDFIEMFHVGACLLHWIVSPTQDAIMALPGRFSFGIPGPLEEPAWMGGGVNYNP